MNTEINNLAHVVRLLSDLNTISQSPHPSDANIDFMEGQLIQAISTMVRDNRDRAYSQSIYADNLRRAIAAGHVAVRSEATFGRRPIRQQRLDGPYTAPLREPVHRNNPLEKSKVVAKKKLEEPCPTECAICQEIPKLKDAVCTDCSHYYCKSCWAGWMNTLGSNRSCPTCRKDMPKTTSYRARASPKPGPLIQAARRPVAIIEFDDDVM